MGPAGAFALANALKTGLKRLQVLDISSNFLAYVPVRIWMPDDQFDDDTHVAKESPEKLAWCALCPRLSVNTCESYM